MQLARLHVRAAARARAPADPRHTKLIKKLNIKIPEDNTYEHMIDFRRFP
jgi:hypothetical protein